MRSAKALATSALLIVFAARCSPFGADTPGGSSGASNPSADAGPPTVQPPPGCDPQAEGEASIACLTNDFAIFVDAGHGADANPGTREAPTKTIGAALSKLSGRARIYVCDGAYPESVKLGAGMHLNGGFACVSWAWTAIKPRIVAPTAGAEALLIEGVDDVVVADLEVESLPGTTAAPNSVAVRAIRSNRVSLRRVSVRAGDGARGADGAAGQSGTNNLVSTDPPSAPADLTGLNANGFVCAPVKTCKCADGSTSTGGAGALEAGANGNSGLPNIGGAAPSDGAGGLGAVANGTCFGDDGHAGAAATDAATAAPISFRGSVVGGRWAEAAGNKGSDGAAGQGGGGGGGRSGPGGTGGGGCGGCGGRGGAGGGGGGGSIGILVVDADLSLVASRILVGNGGSGGRGGSGGVGGSGGAGGQYGSKGVGCGGMGYPGAGGSGGHGGMGGSGGGGAGGVAVGLMYAGKAPKLDDATRAAITLGTPGSGGTDREGGSAAPDGVAEKLKDASQL